LFTVGSFLIATIFQVKGCYDRENDKILNGYEIATSAWAGENDSLKTKLEGLELEIEALNNALIEQSKLINQIKNKIK
jgi:hypothetical protein